MSYGRLSIQGIEYDLTHLDDHVIHVPRPDGAATYRVLVQYGRHCFTRELLAGDHEDLYIQDGKEIRCFCPMRTAMSRELRSIIGDAVAGIAYFTLDSKMLLVEDASGVAYAVFFKMEASRANHLVEWI